ncbi:MAG: hypothetical protein ACOCUT_01205 [bacterium]
MKQSSNNGKFLKVMLTSLVLLILGCLLAVLGVKAASSSNGYQSNTAQKPSEAQKDTKQKVVKDFLLKPGGSVSIETGGREYFWEHWDAGIRGQPVLSIRFTFLSGEVSAWENIHGEHLNDELPLWSSVRKVEFEVPPFGRHQKLEVTVM